LECDAETDSMDFWKEVNFRKATGTTSGAGIYLMAKYIEVVKILLNNGNYTLKIFINVLITITLIIIRNTLLISQLTK
jgi:hypothetical protein